MVESKALPVDIIEKILSRLPVKSLMRFKCVKRDWYTLIPTVFNRSNHQVILIKTGVVMLPSSYSNSTDCQKPTELLRDQHGNMFAQITGYSNGLLCIIHHNRRNVTVLNPSTRKSKVIPLPIKKYNDGLCTYGFWYDKIAKDYKLFVFEIDDNNVIIYSLSTSSWRSVGKKMRAYTGIHFQYPGILVNDALHWLVCVENEIRVLAFNCMTEKFYELSLFSNVTSASNYSDMYLTMFERQLCIIFRTSEVFDAWVMEEYGCPESWVKQLTIEIPEYVDQPFSHCYKWQLPANLLLYGQKIESVRPLSRKKSIKFFASQVYSCLESLATVDIDK